MKCKIFASANHHDLEDTINSFLDDEKIEIVNITYSQGMNYTCYSVVILYENIFDTSLEEE